VVVGVRIRHSKHLFEEPFDCGAFHIGRGPCLAGTKGGGAQGVGPQEDSSGPGHRAEGRSVLPCKFGIARAAGSSASGSGFRQSRGS
jgi:hypothetical protein